MINVLIVDDSNEKVANIIKVIRNISDDLNINIVIDFVSAQEQLIGFQYDLLILDINLPIRSGEKPSFDIGKNLLNEINRKSSLQSPFYIISLTQFEEATFEMNGIWKTVTYNPETTEWKLPIVELIKHIAKTGLSAKSRLILKPTIFVEGKTDALLIKESINVFKPEMADKIEIKSEKSSGASWVARQIIVWAHALKKVNNEYIRAIGLFDGDSAGKDANDDINRVIKINSAESKTFKTIKLSPKFAKHIIPLRQKGLELPICLEEMFDSLIWSYAKTQNWLTSRTNAETILVNPDKWNKFDLSLKDFLLTLDLTEEEHLYLYQFKDDCKEKLGQYVNQLDEASKRKCLICFEPLVLEINEYLFPNN
jgi:CheY-like chemotaxis protein